MHLEHILDELNDSLDQDAPGTSLRVLKKAFTFLASYLADLVEATAAQYGEFESRFMERGDAVECMETIRRGLEQVQATGANERPEVRALLECFYEPGGGGGRRFARLMGIGGSPRRGSVLLPKFMGAPHPPSRKKCIQEIQLYVPVLREWLDATSTLFRLAPILAEHTSLAGRQSFQVQAGERELQVGKRIDIGGCPLCIPQKDIAVPVTLYEHGTSLFVPQRTPEGLLPILSRLDLAMKKNRVIPGCLELRNALEYLIRYFAGVASKVCEELGALPREAHLLVDNSRSIFASEKLLNLCLESLRRLPDAPAAKSLTSVFYRRLDVFDFAPRWHTEILALNGQLSAWCLMEPGQGDWSDPEVCKVEFEKHVLTLREWLIAMSGYLLGVEHFFNEPKSEGYVEFSVRIGDKFVEVAEPGYLFWLNNPRPEGEVAELEASEGAAKPLIRESLEIPAGCPEVLERILTRMDLYLRLGDPVESCISLRDALDYLTRYFAGVAVAAFRELGTLPEEAERLAQQTLSVHDCERLLILSLQSIGKATEEKLGQAVRSVFFYTEEFSASEKPTGAHSRLLALDADPNSKMQNLAEFCSLEAGQGALANPTRARRELERFLPTLQDWMAMAGHFFKGCSHHEEPPEEDGRTELVIEYQDFYLELVEPDYTFYIRPGADVVPDLEAPELPPPDLAFDDDLVDTPVRLKSPEESGRERPFLVHRVELIGDRPNSAGKRCAAGFIVLTNAGSGTLSGTAHSTDASVEVEPPRFRGNKVQLSYWVDTETLPKTHEVFIQLKTAQEERNISVYEMIGQAVARPVSKAMGTLFMFAPSLLWLTLLVSVFQLVTHFMHRVLVGTVGEGYLGLRLVRDAPDAYSEVILAAQALGALALWVAGFTPVMVARIYRSFPPSTRELLAGRRLQMMLLPSAFVGVAMFTPLLSHPLSRSLDFPVMNMKGQFLYFLGLNLASFYYQEMSLSERLDDLFYQPTPRKLACYAAWAIFLVIIVLATMG